LSYSHAFDVPRKSNFRAPRKEGDRAIRECEDKARARESMALERNVEQRSIRIYPYCDAGGRIRRRVISASVKKT